MKKRRATLSNILKDNRYTQFEREVFRAVRAIQPGEVRSYKWVALKINRPRSYRAVGNALNKNAYPRLVPCHRVIRQDGTIGGYAWGAIRKRKLLKAEGIDPSTGLPSTQLGMVRREMVSLSNHRVNPTASSKGLTAYGRIAIINKKEMGSDRRIARRDKGCRR